MVFKPVDLCRFTQIEETGLKLAGLTYFQAHGVVVQDQPDEFCCYLKQVEATGNADTCKTVATQQETLELLLFFLDLEISKQRNRRRKKEGGSFSQLLG